MGVLQQLAALLANIDASGRCGQVVVGRIVGRIVDRVVVDPIMKLACGKRSLDLTHPVVMGILNITPDSFSDGGQYFRDGRSQIDQCLRAAQQMVDDGASIVDVGGESTRPGAAPVSSEEEMARVMPVLEAVATRIDVVISVDTSNPLLMTAAARVGAGLINDVRALEREGALQAAAQSGLPVCLMHRQGEPATMQVNPVYDDAVQEVRSALLARVEACVAAGIAPQRILLDPGFGFGKTLEHNLQLLAQLEVLSSLPYPVLVGLSRKSMIGKLTGRTMAQGAVAQGAAAEQAVAERLPGSLALAQIALDHGARILRVHDVAATMDMLNIWRAVSQYARKGDH